MDTKYTKSIEKKDGGFVLNVKYWIHGIYLVL